MKRALIGILAAIVVLSSASTGALAAGRGHHSACGGEFCRYADEDDDGVCDYCNLDRDECSGYLYCANGGHGAGHGHGFRGGRHR